MIAVAAVIVGLVILVWSADRFVTGAAATAWHFQVPPLLIGMVIIGFGTSAPEMVVSAMAASQGNPGLALGNAYGSNITNIALILGITALISPLLVHSQILRKELPILLAVTALAAWQLVDGTVSRLEAFVLLGVFAALITWTIREGMSGKADQLGTEVSEDLDAVAHMPLRRALLWLAVGLIALIAASRLLVWGAIDIAVGLGISDLVIGLTVVAIGTSLPELASSVIAARKGENDIALGNIIGSNLFNTLAVVGIAGGINAITVPPEVLTRDVAVMAGLAALLCVLGYRRNGPGRINRLEGGVLLLCFGAYTAWLLTTSL
ncbi:calcium/sodium antiporter [Haliea sp. E1-2-M8]|uniref:calcium/sodium antiporter n=1 Tax=Haliea sp. E1-2-M8 TaxID=3064706 RepID=UPI0027274940|nr:calcium/sodium antiporter [Haliea sp. E1-2-M8]MDO8860587.1 calcium/sodium antiporter [Haliea sp. E1-2-M8]